MLDEDGDMYDMYKNAGIWYIGTGLKYCDLDLVNTYHNNKPEKFAISKKTNEYINNIIMRRIYQQPLFHLF